MFRIIYMR